MAHDTPIVIATFNEHENTVELLEGIRAHLSDATCSSCMITRHEVLLSVWAVRAMRLGSDGPRPAAR